MLIQAAYGQAEVGCIAIPSSILSIVTDIAKRANTRTEKITHETKVTRMALGMHDVDTPFGGAAPCAASTPQKRGPPTLLTGLGGRLPTWTLWVPLLLCKNMLTALGSW